MNIINGMTEKISNFKIERMNILQKTQEKEIEYIPVKEENTRNKINLMLVDEWSDSEEKKFCKHRISKFTLTATSCVLSYFGVLEKSKTNALIIFFCFGVVLMVNNFSFSNKVLKRFLKDKNIINTILLLISLFVTGISITSNYICTRHFTDVQLLNIFSAIMVDILPVAYNYMYETNVLENEIKQNERQKEQKECVKSASKSLRTEESKSASNDGEKLVAFTGIEKKDVKSASKSLRTLDSVKHVSSRKDIKNLEDMQNAINQLEDNTIITPKKLNMIKDKNYYNWIKKCNNVKKIDNKYMKVKTSISLVKAD